MQNNNNDRSPAWVVDGGQVCFEGKPLKHADPRTFTVLNDLYARDASRLFCKAGHVSAIVDPATFEVLDAGWFESSRGNIEYAGYARDRGNIYFAEAYGKPPRVVHGAEAATFVSLGFAYGRDAKQVYFQNAAIPDAIPESFELMNAQYSRDARHVYYFGRRVEGAVASEFVLIDELHGRDNQQVYFAGSVGDAARERPNSMRIHRNVLLPLLTFLGGVLLVASAIGSLFRRRSTTEDEVEPSPPERAADLRVIAQTLAVGDHEALAPVLLAIDDPEAFVEKYAEGTSFADEPDLANIIEELEGDSNELDPFTVLTEVYHVRGLLGIIDWRSEPEETISQVDRMLHRFDIRNFDWSFIDFLYERGDGTEMKNQNFLSLLRDRLQLLGLTFVSIDLLSDSYAFAVLRAEEYPKIAGCADPGRFKISTEFGADEDYERGKRILADWTPRG